MSAVAHTYDSDLTALEEATDYAVSNMQPSHLGLWHLKQMCLTDRILDRTLTSITDLPNTEMSERNQLKFILTQLGKLAFPYLIAGTAANPVHHSFQTVENILLVLRHPRNRVYQTFQTYKKATILALLHDTGNGYVDPNLKKVKSSDITDRRRELSEQGKTDSEIEKDISTLIDQATEYRKAHMIKGAEIAVDLLDQAGADLIGLHPDEIDEIADIIRIHDNPSIAEYYSRANQPFGKEQLIPLDQDLAYLLREADRLWMVSKEGLEKDLFDDLKKGNKPDPFSKLRHNVKRFKDEYQLYKKADDFTPQQLDDFKNNTLFRTEGGFEVCKCYVRERIHELTIECFGTEFADA